MSNTTTKSVPYTIKTDGAIVLYINGECQTVTSAHENYNKILAKVKDGDFDNIESLMNVAKAIENYAGDKVSIKNGEIYYGSLPLHNTLTERVIKMMSEGFKINHMLKFLDNLLENPSRRAVSETYTFLQNYGLPITEDGCFLAYKAVDCNYKDIYTRKIDNSIGATPQMPRNMVDESYEQDCSHGLHVGALDYVITYGHFVRGEKPAPGGNRLLIVKVNPKNVVSVPKYERHPKMRVCEYTVVSEISDVVKELEKSVYTANATAKAPDVKTSSSSTYTPAGNFHSAMTDTFTKTPVDTTSPWNADKYIKGWNAGSEDSDNDREYGYSRDYSEENSYRIGYNDAYNGRENQAESGGDYSDESDCCGCGCDCKKSDVDDESLTESAEYKRGYDLGETDYNTVCYFEQSLNVDASDAFKRGYAEGWDDSEGN